MDKNPSFGVDKTYEYNAQRVTNLLWETTKGDLSKFPQQYLETLEYEYSDGYISLLPLLNRVELSDATYEEFSEVVSNLIRVEPDQWPELDSILSIQGDKLLYEVETEPFEFSEWEFDFASPGDMSDKMELFLKKVISSVYTDGVTSVTDVEGNPPNARNNYLMAADGKSFSGVFHDAPGEEKEKHFAFVIKEGRGGNWEIKY